MTRQILILLMASAPLIANATGGKLGPIDLDVFDPDSPNFAGQDAAFFASLTSTDLSDFQSAPITTGGLGFRVDSSKFGGIALTPDLEKTLIELTTADLFGQSTPPPGANDATAKSGFTPLGAEGGGFSGFQFKHRQNVDVGQADDETQQDLFAQNTSFIPFETAGAEEPVMANIKIDFDALLDFAEDGFLSAGITFALLDVTDPLNSFPIAGVNGFFFFDSKGPQASFTNTITGEDLTKNFSYAPTDTGPDAPLFATFSYDIDVPLDPNKTYALGGSNDSSSGVTGFGFSNLNSRNTLIGSINLVGAGNARLVAPGVVPEPAAATLLAVAVAAAAVKRR